MPIPGPLPFLAAIACVLLAGCSTPAGIVPPQDAEGRYLSTMGADLKFDPPIIRVPVGGTVLWTNTGAVAHDVSVYWGDNDHSEWSASMDRNGQHLQQGDAAQYTFTKAGTWTVWCHPHHEERMQQTVHVG